MTLGLHKISFAGFEGVEVPGGVTGAVVSSEAVEHEPLPLISWAVILIGFSLVISLMILRHVHKSGRRAG